MVLDANAPKHRIVQLLDLRRYTSHKDGTLTRSNRTVDRGEMCYFATPMDMPAYVRFWRRITRQDQSENAVVLNDHGVTMEVDCFTFGVKVYVRYDRPTVRGSRGKLHVMVEDHEGIETLARYGDGE
jgi:hypothetical protein